MSSTQSPPRLQNEEAIEIGSENSEDNANDHEDFDNNNEGNGDEEEFSQGEGQVEEGNKTVKVSSIVVSTNYSFEDHESISVRTDNDPSRPHKMTTFRGRHGTNLNSSGDGSDTCSKRSLLHKQKTLKLFSLQESTKDIAETEDQIELKVELKTTHRRNAGGQYTIIAFINSGSGGGRGKAIYKDLSGHLGEDYVFDLGCCQSLPRDILVQFALDPKVRVLACGGDGTQGWILSEIDQVWIKMHEHKDTIIDYDSIKKNHLPLAIMPLGTGNDLSRMFNWGTKYNASMRKESFIRCIENSTQAHLDRWKCSIIPYDRVDDDSKNLIPHMLLDTNNSDRTNANTSSVSLSNHVTLKKFKALLFDEDCDGSTSQKLYKRQSFFVKMKKHLPGGSVRFLPQSEYSPSSKSGASVMSDSDISSTQIFDGVFNNYLSFGFDAGIANSFHTEREAHPERFTSTTKNKLKYLEKGITEGGFLRIRKSKLPPLLHDKIRILVLKKKKKAGSGSHRGCFSNDFEEVPVPTNCRGIAFLNIQSYSAGQKIINGGEYDDGLIEIVFMPGLTSLVSAASLCRCMKFKIAEQVDRILIRIIDEPVYCQVDGEPWLQEKGIFQLSFFGRSPILRNDSKQGCSLG